VEVALYARNIPRLEALREIRLRRVDAILDPPGWKQLYLNAYQNLDLAEKAEAAAMLAQGGKDG
jgi:hypothetical protein